MYYRDLLYKFLHVIRIINSEDISFNGVLFSGDTFSRPASDRCRCHRPMLWPSVDDRTKGDVSKDGFWAASISFVYFRSRVPASYARREKTNPVVADVAPPLWIFIDLWGFESRIRELSAWSKARREALLAIMCLISWNYRSVSEPVKTRSTLYI